MERDEKECRKHPSNPLTDIRVTEKVSHTMINGRLFDAATMDEILPTPAKRGKFFWEN